MGVIAEPGRPGLGRAPHPRLRRLGQFYKDVFGWDDKTMSDTAEFRYTTLGRARRRWPGSWTPPTSCPRAVPAHWAVYLAVEDTDAAVKTTTELGASWSRRA